ncbi:hypothetical protein Hamer_G023222 [Homarus americanus]|uniref:Uncharacterized protein n=1 Tax=Homarus americanus TaxID=6706 RepID=A0A8J5MLF2_HOMAM|nr:hypothetical protein Hamer_G023222 [Homarus americanus]
MAEEQCLLKRCRSSRFIKEGKHIMCDKMSNKKSKFLSKDHAVCRNMMRKVDCCPSWSMNPKYHHSKFKVKNNNNFIQHPHYFLFRLFCVHMVAACSS